MSDSGSANSNSWTILSPEETVAETLRPLAEGSEPLEDASTAEPAAEPACETESPAEAQPEVKDLSTVPPLPVDDHQVEEKTTAGSGEDANSHPTLDTDLTHSPVADDDPAPTPEDPVPVFTPSDAEGQSEGLPEALDLSSPDPDSFSDSYTHISPSPEEPSTSVLTAETLGAAETSQEEEGLEQEEPPQPLNGEGLIVEGEELELPQSLTDLGKFAESPLHSEVVEQEEKVAVLAGDDGEPGLRRRRRSSLQAVLERIGRKEEEDEEPQAEFHLPQPEEDSGFSVNKCLLGALILLGLGTIFFSGVFMDLDAESDYGTSELGDADVPVKEAWLNPEVPPPPVDVDNAELMNKLAEESPQMAVLQAQFQAQREELNVASGLAAEGAKERLRREEVEKENANEAPPPPVTPTEAPPTGDTSTTVESQPSEPGVGEKAEMKKESKKEKYDAGEKEEWKYKEKRKEGDRKERKDSGKTEWKEKEKDRKKEKYEHGKYEKDGMEWKQKEEKKKKEWKKDKPGRGDEGKPWKDREGEKERKERSERKEWKDDKEWKKGKKKEGKEGKKHGERREEEWKGGKEWKKGKGGHKESDKAWREKEKKEWTGKGEKREWKKEGKHGDGQGWRGKDERGGGKEGRKEGRKDGEWKKAKRGDAHEGNRDNRGHEKHRWQGPGDGKPAHAHPRPSVGEPAYWDHRRQKMQRSPATHNHCDSVETCAQAEGLRPVPLAEFQAFLLGYLAKAEGVGVEASRSAELSSLTAEFFRDGVFAHDHMSFQEFAEDVADILEDMVEGEEEVEDEEDGEEEEDSAIEREMDEFETEVMKKFAVPELGGKEERKRGEWKERGRARG